MATGSGAGRIELRVKGLLLLRMSLVDALLDG